jgi:nitroreductase
MTMTSRENVKTTLAATLALVVGGASSALWFRSKQSAEHKPSSELAAKSSDDASAASTSGEITDDEHDLSVLPCLRNRRSIFPKSYLKDPPPVDDSIIQSLLDAAMWGPFHGKCYAGCQHPARFVVLGKQAMIDMQTTTLDYYDKHWKQVGWGSGGNAGGREEDYLAWRKMTHDEIAGRWGPCSHMIAVVMRRQSGPKRLPEWEEAAAVAAATQNMHVQSTKFPNLACYWSSWHEAVRDSDELKTFLKMEPEDKCMGMFIIAQRDPKRCSEKDRRKRDRSIMQVEWRK